MTIDQKIDNIDEKVSKLEESNKWGWKKIVALIVAIILFILTNVFGITVPSIQNALSSDDRVEEVQIIDE